LYSFASLVGKEGGFPPPKPAYVLTPFRAPPDFSYNNAFKFSISAYCAATLSLNASSSLAYESFA